MSLRWKVLVFVIAISATGAGSSYFVQQWVVGPQFDRAERERAAEDATRCVQALRRECDYVARNAADYARWDDAYAFVEDGNAAFIASNLTRETFENLGLNLLVIARLDGGLIWGELRDAKHELHAGAADVIADIARSGHPLLALSSDRRSVSGVLMTPHGPLLVGAQAITDSKGQAPIRGALIMGRLFDSKAVSELAERTRVWTQFWPVAEVVGADRNALERLTGAKDAAWVADGSADVIHGYALIRDVFGRPALLQRANLPRAISRHARAAAQLAVSVSLLGGVALSLVMWIVLTQIVLKPLGRVTEHAVRVGTSDDPAERLDLRGADEIATLAREFDRMVERLAESRAQLVDVARHAGKADVATNVLHNVGNVLNSVNVSANVAADRLQRSELPSLAQAAQLLDQHRDHLAEFLTQNERGRELPTFLSELARFLGDEQRDVLAELRGLGESIDHIRRIIDMQQVHGKSSGMIERIDPADVIDQALRLNAAALERHAVRVEREIEAIGPMLLDRHKVLQILVNLLTNATHALKGCDTARCLRLSLARVCDGRMIEFAVRDNGVGIAPEKITQIFRMGFTMRPDGHGFGLHGAALMAREMGGSLLAESDGLGAGATFRLALPIQTEVRA